MVARIFTSAQKMRGMMMLKVLIAVSFLALIRAELKVTQVQAVFRHGERTPDLDELHRHGIDDVSKYEPWGFGDLTKTGKMREYRVGQMLRTRYQELLGSLRIPDGVYAMSTVIDRAKISLQFVLAGLFPPQQTYMWNSRLPWMPIPAHYVPGPLDIELNPTECPELRNAFSRVMQLPEVKAKVASHEDLFKFLTVKSGLNITGIDELYGLFNLLMCHKSMNFTLPEWFTDEVMQEMSEVCLLRYEMWSYTTEMKRLNGGQLVRTFIENMHLDSVREYPRKMYLYSTHKTNVVSFLLAHGVVVSKLPPYGTAVMVEKLRDSHGRLYVRFVMWTGVNEQLITLQLPGCKEICPIERYLQLTRKVIPSDEERQCLWKRLSADMLRKAFREVMS